MDLDASEPVTLHCNLHQLRHASTVAFGVNERESVETVRLAGDDPGDFAIGDRVIGMERWKQHGLPDPCPRRAFQVPVERRVGVPWSRETIAFTGVAVAIDDHFDAPIPIMKWIDVCMPRAKVGKWSFSFGACAPSSGSAKPIRTEGSSSKSRNRVTTGMVPPLRK